MTTTRLFRLSLCICFSLIYMTVNGQQYLEFLNDESLTFQEKVTLAESHFDDKGRGKHTGYKQFLRWKYFAQRKVNAQGYVISDRQATKAYQDFISKNPALNRSAAAPWIEKGPLSATNTSTWSSHIGRITNIGIDPNNDQHMIVTSPGGGVWKTTNEGGTWTPIFDNENSMSVWSAVISRTNSDHYMVATSGNGIRKSTDGGTTWGSVNGEGGTIYTIKQHPTNAQIYLACSSNGNIYRSTNGGDDWASISVSGPTLYDIEFMPGNANIVYTSGRSGSLFKSTDNGQSWATVNGPWANRSLMMAVCNQAPNYLYVLQESGGGFGAMYLSRDAGSTFEKRSDNGSAGNIMGYNTGEGGGQAPRDMDIIVAPNDTNEVHVAGIMTNISLDAGATWTRTTHWVLSNPLPFVHADIDQMIYSGNKIYVASDGGVFISSDKAASFEDKTTGLGTRQFYRIAASTTEVGRVAGGSQDNGTGVLVNGEWLDFVGADGMEPVIANEDEDLIYASIQYGDLYRSSDGGNTVNGISEPTGANGSWVTPIEKDPLHKNTIYQAKTQVYKSTNRGASWKLISGVNGSGNADELCIAQQDNNIIYVSFSSTLFKTDDGGVTWNNVTPANGVNAGFINYINTNPNDDDHIILATGGGAKIVESTDGGATWNNITLNLPSVGANSVVFDGRVDNGIYISMTKGVYYKDDTAPNAWVLMDMGLPNVDVTELEIITDKLYAATYGRGLWEMTIPGRDCVLRPNIEMSEIDDQDNDDLTDDTFTFTIEPKGIGTNGTYDITGDIVANNLTFDEVQTFDNGGAGFLVDDGPLTLTITPDNGGQNCPITFKVNSLREVIPVGNYFCDSALVINRAQTYAAPGPSLGGGAETEGRSANWYRFIAPKNGLLTVFSCGSGKDTNLKIYSGNCANKTLVAEVDDNCLMGPDQDNYASRLENLPMIAGQSYFIEWDNRWSSDPFDFFVEFEEDCIDELFLAAEGLASATFVAEDKIELSGNLTANITLQSPGEIIIPNDLNVQSSGLLETSNAACLYSEGYDWAVVAATTEEITDNNTTEIELIVPASFTQTIADVHVLIDLEHTYLGDLTITLEHPLGESITIWNRYCGGTDDLNFILNSIGISGDICGDDWRSGGHLYASPQVPVNSLQTFINRSAAGTWKLRITDEGVGDTGVINKIGLFFK